MRYLLIFTLFCTLSNIGWAQEKRYQKALDYYLDNKPEKAYKTLQKALGHEETRSYAEVHLLNAQILISLYEDDFLSAKYPKAVPDAIKSAAKALAKSNDRVAYYASKAEFFKKVEDLALEEAELDLKLGRYTQAQRKFEKLTEFSNNERAQWGIVRCALGLQDTTLAMSVTAALIKSIFAAKVEINNYQTSLDETPFLFYTNRLIGLDLFDSSMKVSEAALSVFNDRSDLLRQQLLRSFLLEVTRQKPSPAALTAFSEMRPKFEHDSTFISKENVLYLYLINQLCSQGMQPIADSLLTQWYELKRSYYAKRKLLYERQDPLFAADGQEFLLGLIRYNARFERTRFISLLISNYIYGTYAEPEFRGLPMSKRWQKLFEKISEEKNALMLVLALPLADEQLLKEKWYVGFRRELMLKSMQNHREFADRNTLLRLVPYAAKNYSKDAQVMKATSTLSLHLIGEYIDSAYFTHAKLTSQNHKIYFGTSAEWLALKRKFVEQDFIVNYYGSRLKADTIKGQLVSEFSWNGDETKCDAGRMPVSVQRKVEQRINYFRRNAGVPDDVVLDRNKNRQCQLAALAYHANKGKYYPTISETWRCYTAGGAEIAPFSAKIFGQHTVFAITSLMADKDDANAGAGNRRWLLYPAAKMMGHGSTSRIAVINTLDDSGNNDTLDYTQAHQFVSWPPADFCPLMFNFERWHFSLYADLSAAKVSVKLAGKELALTQEPYTLGYGMPALVWKPHFEVETEQVYNITIQNVKLHGQSKPISISYQVTFINPMKK